MANEQKTKCSFVALVGTIIIIGMISCCVSAEIVGEVIADMPVREVTVFKDGHAFVLHEGPMPVNSQGDVVLDYLPRPIMGTFWAYSADPKVKLNSVVSGRRLVTIEHTSLTVRELIEGNLGAKVRIKENNNNIYEAVIQDIPTRSSPPDTFESLPQRGDIVLLKVAEGVKAVPLSHINEVTFLQPPRSVVNRKEFRNVMTLKLEGAETTAQNAEVGMVYVQRGIRWIPSYRVDIDGKGKAVIKLQATLINELTDLVDVKAHLVIGVPSFAFKDTPDPISLQ